MEKSLLQNKTALVLGPIIFTFWLAANGFCQVGGEAGSYLRSPTGAAMTACGGSQTAEPQYLSTWWNPAQLSNLTKSVFTLGSGLYSLGRTEAFSAFEFKLPPRVGIGVCALYRGDQVIDNLYTLDETKLEPASFTTLTFKAALSYLVTRKLSLGLSLGVFYQRLPTSYSESFTESGNETALNYSDATSVSGFSFGMQYRVSDSVSLGLVLRDVDPLQGLSGKPSSITLNWQLVSPDSYNTTVTDEILPALVLGVVSKHRLYGKPLRLSCDIEGYLFDGTYTKLDHMEAHVHAGAQWQRWQTFCIRLGINDIVVNRDLYDAPSDYWRDFGFRITGGFGWDVTILKKPMTINYSVATDKVWAGIDQMLDFVYKF